MNPVSALIARAEDRAGVVSEFTAHITKISAAAPDILVGAENASLQGRVDSMFLFDGRRSIAEFSAEAVNAADGMLKTLIDNHPAAKAFVDGPLQENPSPYVQAFASAVANAASAPAEPEIKKDFAPVLNAPEM